MILRTVIEMPNEATLETVASVIEALTGFGYVRETNLSDLRMAFEFDATKTGPLDPVETAIVLAAVAFTGVRGDSVDLAMQAAVAAATIAAQWSEIETTLISHGWKAPESFEVAP